MYCKKKHNMVPPEKFKPMTPLSQVGHSTTGWLYRYYKLFGKFIATWYAMSSSHVKLTEIGTSCGHG